MYVMVDLRHGHNFNGLSVCVVPTNYKKVSETVREGKFIQLIVFIFMGLLYKITVIHFKNTVLNK